MSQESLVEQVRSKYAAVAASGLSGGQLGVRSVAEAFGYSPEELAAVPGEAHLGLSCGNPTATAHLRPGEIVVDLGCGAGIDVLLASLKVGPSGKAIGIDMTAEMIERANASASKFGHGQRPANVEFRLGRIEALPLEDASVDCLISNCVINLVPDKAAAFREMVRVLKPGGRLAITDIALKAPLPEELARSVAAYVGCIAGAVTLAEYERLLYDAGFAEVQIIDTRKDLSVYAQIEGQGGCCEPGPVAPNAELVQEIASLFALNDVNDYAASIQVYALKSQENRSMKTIEIYDRPLCCSTGICGPQVDPALVHFAADLDWLRENGAEVQRFNLAFEPGAFTRHEDVKAALQLGQVGCLPLVRVNGQIVCQGRYPSREELAGWCGLVTQPAQPVAQAASSCCAPGCC